MWARTAQAAFFLTCVEPGIYYFGVERATTTTKPLPTSKFYFYTFCFLGEEKKEMGGWDKKGDGIYGLTDVDMAFMAGLMLESIDDDGAFFYTQRDGGVFINGEDGDYGHEPDRMGGRADSWPGVKGEVVYSVSTPRCCCFSFRLFFLRVGWFNFTFVFVFFFCRYSF